MQAIARVQSAMALTVLLSTSVSCVRNELADGATGGEASTEICFSLTPVKTGTKATTFSAFPADSAFGTIAWYLPKGKTWRDHSDEAVLYIGQEKISCGVGVWKAWESGQTYWWPEGGQLTFFSWAPYCLKDDNRFSLDRDNGGLVIRNWTVEPTPGYGADAVYGTAGAASSKKCVDLLTARSTDLSGNSANTWSVADGTAFSGYGAKIQFRHALCRVSFVISLDYAPEDGAKWFVENVSLQDIYTCGTFRANSWVEYAASSISDYGVSFVTSDTPDGLEVTAAESKTLFPKTMMIPQPLTSSTTSGTLTRTPRITIAVWKKGSYDSTGKKDIQYLTGLLYSNTTERIRWGEGTDITYHVYIATGAENYIDFDASVGGWSTGGDSDIEMK